MKSTRPTRVIVALGVAIVAVLIAGIASATVMSLSAGKSESPAATHRLGTEICFGFGRVPLSQYRETAATLPQVVAEADTLRASVAWQPVGDALARMTALGPTREWTTAQRATAVQAFHALHVACRPHLR